MVAQSAAEVIVVDFSCPEAAGDWVASNFVSARVVSVEGQKHFSNWKARNAGAAIATSEVLVFVDADTVLADGAIDRLAERLPDGVYGYFDRETSKAFNQGGPVLGANQLKGFHVVPAEAFGRVGGYDEVLEGYAAGADTDLEERLLMIGLVKHVLDPLLIESVINHDAASRTEHHSQSIGMSYGAGLLYRAAKRVLLRAGGHSELPLPTRQQLYDAARRAVSALGSERDRVSLDLKLGREPVLMPRQLGYERGSQTVSLRVELSLQDKLTDLPE